jgi:alanine or glycine:cation symporter, AGCS family
MLTTISNFLDLTENFLWSYFGVPVIIVLGLYFSYQSGFVQIRKLPTVFRTFFGFLKFHNTAHPGGVHPLKAFFAAVGGCVGIGNVVGICTAVQIGGPGALLWIWLTALAGMILKYSEVYLGLRFRVPNGQGGYNGGPMYFLQKVFKTSFFPKLVCVLLCLYGVEVYQFSVITHSVSVNWGINSYVVIAVLLILVIFAGSGGVKRVGAISSVSLPLFVLIYVGMGSWVLINNITLLPEVIVQIFNSAFTGQSAVGGFVGASLMTTMSYGIRRGCYTGDIGVGYASVIHSESSAQVPEKQASLAIFDIFLDTFIVCTTSILLVLTTGLWHEPIEAGLLVQTALGQYFPYMEFFMPLFLFMLGYNTINAYFCVGLKCADYLLPNKGRYIYYSYAVVALLVFSFLGTVQAQTAMAIVGVLLLLINAYGIFCLRKEISFNLDGALTESVPETELSNSSVIT